MGIPSQWLEVLRIVVEIMASHLSVNMMLDINNVLSSNMSSLHPFKTSIVISTPWEHSGAFL